MFRVRDLMVKTQHYQCRLIPLRQPRSLTIKEVLLS